VDSLLNDPDRLVEVAWDKDFHSPFQVRLEIIGADRAGLLSDIMAVLMEMKISANWVNARGRKDNTGVVEMILEVKNLEQLDYIISKFSRVKDVYSVHRTGKSMISKARDKA
jgi:GTP pyrophosphokinase